MELLKAKVPPNSKELEEMVIGAILVEPISLPVVLNLVFKEVFYTDAHILIFRAVLRLYDANRGIDVSTVCRELQEMGYLEQAGGAYGVTKITNKVVSSANIETHCRILLQLYLKRQLIEMGMTAINQSYDDSTDSFELYDKLDNKLINTQELVLKGQVKDMNYYSGKVYDQYETIKQTGVLGIKTGIEPIDKICSGLVAPDLFIIAARPSQGKTAIAMSITHNCSILNNLPCAWFSLEMDGIQLTRRLASIDSGVPHEFIRNGKIFSDVEPKFYNSLDKIARSPIFIEDSGTINVRSIRTRANILKRKHDIQYLVVDYLQLISGVDSRNKNRNEIIGEVTRGLKELARELQMPVIALSQLSREVEKRPDKMPQMSDLRESGSIEQDADEVLFLMRPEKYGFTEPSIIGGIEYPVQNLCIGKLDKNRHGECKNFAMSFSGTTMKIGTHTNDELMSTFSSKPKSNFIPSDEEPF